MMRGGPALQVPGRHLTMEIRIPRFIVLACRWTFDRLAVALMPPPRPIGLVILGYNLTWTDVGLAAWTMVLAAGSWWWYGRPLMAAAVILTIIAGCALTPLPSEKPEEKKE